MRDAFVRALLREMEKDGRIIGQNVFMETLIEADSDDIPTSPTG